MRESLQRFTVAYTGGAAPGAHEALLRFHTSNTDEPLVEVPVHYEIVAAGAGAE